MGICCAISSLSFQSHACFRIKFTKLILEFADSVFCRQYLLTTSAYFGCKLESADVLA